MEANNLQFPGYRVSEFRIVLNPHEELARKVMRVREEFGHDYKAGVIRTPPHIPLVRFLTWDIMEEKLVQRLQATGMGITPFKVVLRDYGSFPSHSIFVNVVSRLPIQDIVRQLKESQRLMKLNNENRPHFMDEPHIPIAQKLKPWQYEGGWQAYSHRQFSGSFVADGMLLLKRPAGDRGSFQVVRRFDFLNLPVTTKQGSLFI